MKSILKRAIRNERGAALVLAIILLLVGGLISAALLGHMGTGILAGEVYETRTSELYAADAGVEDAVWRIQNATEVKPPTCITDPTSWNYAISDVNDKSVDVTVDYQDDGSFKITSIAITADGGNTAAIVSSTTVEAYIEAMTFDLLGGALVSSGDIAFHKDCDVTGDVYYVGEITGTDYTHTEGEEIQIPPSVFPTQEQNVAFAQQFAQNASSGGTTTYDGDMTISSDTTLGPKYITGNLDIDRDVTITLAGVVYVKGHIKCENTLTITGAGSLVAEDYIYLSKLADYTVTGDSIIMSLNGAITLKKSDPADELSINAFVYAPNGSITFDKDMTVVGSVIGAGIEIDKDGTFTYLSKASSFKFPPVVVYGAKIKTYSVTQS